MKSSTNEASTSRGPSRSASRAGSAPDDFADVLEASVPRLARSKSHVTLRSEPAEAPVVEEDLELRFPEPVKAVPAPEGSGFQALEAKLEAKAAADAWMWAGFGLLLEGNSGF